MTFLGLHLFSLGIGALLGGTLHKAGSVAYLKIKGFELKAKNVVNAAENAAK